MIVKLKKQCFVNGRIREAGEIINISNTADVEFEILKSDIQMQSEKIQTKQKIESLKNDSIKQDAIYIKS